MKRSFFVRHLLLSISLFLFLSSCEKDSDIVDSSESGTSGKIETGSLIEVGTASVGSAGGNINVSKPGTPIDGMVITIPSNSFTTTKTFTISYAEIKGHQFGQNFNPISPMISVTYEGGYAKDGMSVKIPITLPTGHFAMGFFYDDKTGKLEGIPIESLDNNFITVNTRSFTTASSLNKRTGTRDAASMGTMIISSISESVLNQQTIISSGFSPGVDDWEFVNYGSYISPGGHCAGQSLTAMWYYYEKKLNGAAPLFHFYDKVNNKTSPGLLWQDNPLGYRFASTIQEDFGWDGWVTQMNFRSIFPALSWKAFAASMLLTGEPQSVLIRNSHGLGGHAMIVYAVNFAQGKLYIADPNKPNNVDPSTKVQSIRTIDYVNGKFNSYFAGLSADGNPIEMDQICYFGKTAYIDWGQIGNRWAEVENKTIGNNRFPSCTLWVEDGSGYELKDGLNTDADSLFFHCYAPTSPECISGTNRYMAMYVYKEDGSYLATTNAKGSVRIKLQPGINTFGIYIMCAKQGKWGYADFKWINVYCAASGIEPRYVLGGPNVERTWTFGMSSPPANARYEWNFGDSKPTVTMRNNTSVKYTYTNSGSFSVILKVYNDSNNQLVGGDTAYADIVTGLHFIIAKNNTSQPLGTMSDGSESPSSIGNGLAYPIRNLTWNNDSFSGSDSYSTRLGMIRYEPTFTCSGTIDNTRHVLSSLTYTDVKNMYDPDTGNLIGTSSTKVVFKNLPLSGSSNANISGSTLSNYITTIEVSYPGTSGTVTLQSMNWANASFLLSFQK